MLRCDDFMRADKRVLCGLPTFNWPIWPISWMALNSYPIQVQPTSRDTTHQPCLRFYCSKDPELHTKFHVVGNSLMIKTRTYRKIGHNSLIFQRSSPGNTHLHITLHTRHISHQRHHVSKHPFNPSRALPLQPRTSHKYRVAQSPHDVLTSDKITPPTTPLQYCAPILPNKTSLNPAKVLTPSQTLLHASETLLGTFQKCIKAPPTRSLISFDLNQSRAFLSVWFRDFEKNKIVEDFTRSILPRDIS